MVMKNTTMYLMVTIGFVGATGCSSSGFFAGIDDIQTRPDAGLDGATGTENSQGTGGVIHVSCNLTEFPVPTANSFPAGLAVGSDGNLWFTEPNVAKIGRITPKGTITEFTLPTDSKANSITAGPDGNLWFVDGDHGKIGRMSPADGIITEFQEDGVVSITAGPDGNLWFTASNAKIGRISPAGAITEFNLPSSSTGAFTSRTASPMSIVAGSDGNLWFTEFPNSEKIGRITLQGATAEFLVPAKSSMPLGIAAGPDGNLWFTESLAGIGRVTPEGEIWEFSIPTVDANASGIVAGPDGNLWFAESSGNRIAYITPAGDVTECPILADASYPNVLVVGPDGNIWFTESGTNRIAHTNPGE